MITHRNMIGVLAVLMSGMAWGASPTPSIHVVRAQSSSMVSQGGRTTILALDIEHSNMGTIASNVTRDYQQLPFSMDVVPVVGAPVPATKQKRYLNGVAFTESLVLHPVVYAQGHAVLLLSTFGELLVWRPSVQSSQLVAADVLSMSLLTKSQAMLLMKDGSISVLSADGTLTPVLAPGWLPGLKGAMTALAVSEVGSLAPLWVTLYGATDAGEVFTVTYDGRSGNPIKDFGKLEFPKVGSGSVRDDLGNVIPSLKNGVDILRVVTRHGRLSRFAVLGETLDDSGKLKHQIITFLNAGGGAIRYQSHFQIGTQLGHVVAGPYLAQSKSNRARGMTVDAELLGFANTAAHSDRIYFREQEDLVSYDCHGTSRTVEVMGQFSDATLQSMGQLSPTGPAQHMLVSLPSPSLPLFSSMAAVAAPPQVAAGAAQAPAPALTSASPHVTVYPPSSRVTAMHAAMMDSISSKPITPPAKPRNILLEDPTTAQGWVEYLRAEVAKLDREYGFKHSRNLSARLTTKRNFLAALNGTQVFRYHMAHYLTRTDLFFFGLHFQTDTFSLAPGENPEETIDLHDLGEKLQRGKKAREALDCAANLDEYYLK